VLIEQRCLINHRGCNVATESQDQKQIRLKAEAEAAAMRVYRALEVIRQERKDIFELSQKYGIDQNRKTGRRDAESFWKRIRLFGLNSRFATEISPDLPR
jgi:hypothetical protein